MDTAVDAGRARRRSGSCSASSSASRPRCAALARAHRDTPMAGRTLLQQAVPTTFGLQGRRAGSWPCSTPATAFASCGIASRRSSAARRGRSRRSATGASRSRRSSPRSSGSPSRRVPWHANRVRVAELGAALEIAAGVLAKIALDLAAPRADRGRRGPGGRRGRRLVRDAAEAQPGRLRCGRGPAPRSCAAMRRCSSGSLAGEHERGAGAGRPSGTRSRARSRTTGRRRSRAGEGARRARGRRGAHAREPRSARAGSSSRSGSRSSSRSASGGRGARRSCGTRRSGGGERRHARRRSSSRSTRGSTPDEIARADGPDDLPRLRRRIRRPCARTLRARTAHGKEP